MSRWKTYRSAKLKYEMSLQNIEADSSGSEEELMAVHPQGEGETGDQLGPLPAVQLPLPTSTVTGDGTNAMSERASPSINSELSSESDMQEDINSEPESSDTDFNTESDSDTESESEPVIPEEVTGEVAYWAIMNNVPQSVVRPLLKILRKPLPYLPKDPRTLFQTCSSTSGIKELSGGLYYHFNQIANKITSTLTSDPLLQQDETIYLQINVDGVPLFKSTSEQFWPILCMIEGTERREPFIAGLYSGKSKPVDAQAFMTDFMDEIVFLQENGLHFKDKLYSVAIRVFVCDAPARAMLKNVKGHTGYSGCEKCTTRGEYSHEGNKMSYPEVGAPVRTNVAFDEMRDEEHHKGENPLRRLSLGMISQFGLDYMHLICLGVMKRLLVQCWLKGPLHCRIGRGMKNQISGALTSLRSCIPREFARKPRSLDDVYMWKATEFRLFLLYTGPVVLRNIFVGRLQPLYNNFMLLSVGIHILVNPTLYHDFNDQANELLVSFVKHYAALFGSGEIVYNVHNLIHLSTDAKHLGCLDSFSAFPFENFLQQLKKMVRKPNFALAQVIRRLSEISRLAENKVVASEQKLIKRLTKCHTTGPIPDEITVPCTQYKLAKLERFTISSGKGDNTVKVGSHIAQIQNILQLPTGVVVVYKIFRSTSVVSRLSSDLHVCSVDSIKMKYVMLQHEGKSVAMPMIHTH